jgi:ATP-dependent helicase/nuclease subunit A
LDTGKKISWCLSRKNPEAVEAAHALIDAKLKVISGDSLLLTNSPKVRLLVNIFKFISDPANEIARPEILYNYLVYIKQSFGELNSLFSDKLNSNELFIRLMPKGFLSSEGLSLNSELSGKGIYDLTESLLRIFGLLDSADVYLLRFLDVIKKYSDENSGDVYGFISWWDDHMEENTVIVPEEEDAIRVMTIHKAKGLQAPVVYIPFANWDFTINQQSSLMWVSSDKKPFNSAPAYFVKAASALKDTYFSQDYLEEEALTILDNLNLLYVAFTRAEEKLFVGIPLKDKKSFNAGSVIIDAVSGSTELTNNYNAEHSYYEKGNEKYFSGKYSNSPENHVYRMKNLISGDFTKKIKIKTELEGFEPEKIKRSNELKNRGVLLHKALSYIKDSSETEISSALNRLHLQGYITSEQLPWLEKELREIILTGEAADWFKPGSKVMNENDIIMPGGLVYRPDKVILKNDKAVIIDFKSGIKLKEHEDQLKQYGKILFDMGYKNIEMYLYYLTEKKIIKVL